MYCAIIYLRPLFSLKISLSGELKYDMRKDRALLCGCGESMSYNVGKDRSLGLLYVKYLISIFMYNYIIISISTVEYGTVQVFITKVLFIPMLCSLR